MYARTCVCVCVCVCVCTACCWDDPCYQSSWYVTILTCCNLDLGSIVYMHVWLVTCFESCCNGLYYNSISLTGDLFWAEAVTDYVATYISDWWPVLGLLGRSCGIWSCKSLTSNLFQVRQKLAVVLYHYILFQDWWTSYFLTDYLYYRDSIILAKVQEHIYI